MAQTTRLLRSKLLDYLGDVVVLVMKHNMILDIQMDSLKGKHHVSR